jgi:acyl carrier protein phosphodiesterase
LLFPERMQLFYDNMIHYNFLVAYGEEEGITQTLKRLQMRTNSDADFVKSIALIENEKGRLSDLFNEFFMDMQQQLQKLGYR